MKKKLELIMICLCLAFTCCLTYSIGSYLQTRYSEPVQIIRTIDANSNKIDYQGIFNEFEDSKLETVGTLTTFEGVKPISQEDLSIFDNLSESDINLAQNIYVTYKFSYDNATNIATMSAITKNDGIIIEVEEIRGNVFTDNYGNVDAVFEIDGNYVLLSEMQDMGIIQNCGWFKNLFKKIVVAAVAVVAVAAVTTIVVASCGAGLGACIAAGAIAGAVTGGVAGGIISYSEYGKLDWRWVAGGVVVGAAIGAITGWGVGSVAMKTTTAQTNRLIKSAQNGNLDFSNSIKNKSYFQKGNNDYRQYYEQTNLISQEIMKAKSPVIESGTNYLKWTVEGIHQTVKGTTYGKWELIIDPVKEVIVHFLFAS